MEDGFRLSSVRWGTVSRNLPSWSAWRRKDVSRVVEASFWDLFIFPLPRVWDFYEFWGVWQKSNLKFQIPISRFSSRTRFLPSFLDQSYLSCQVSVFPLTIIHPPWWPRRRNKVDKSMSHPTLVSPSWHDITRIPWNPLRTCNCLQDLKRIWRYRHSSIQRRIYLSSKQASPEDDEHFSGGLWGSHIADRYWKMRRSQLTKLKFAKSLFEWAQFSRTTSAILVINPKGFLLFSGFDLKRKREGFGNIDQAFLFCMNAIRAKRVA